MVTPHDNGDVALAEVSGNLIGASGGVGFHGQGYQVCLEIIGNRLQAFVEEIQLNVWCRKASEDGEDQRLHGIV